MSHQRGIHFSLFGRRLPCDGDPVHDPQPHPRRRQLRLRRGLVAQGQVVCVGKTEQLVIDSIPQEKFRQISNDPRKMEYHAKLREMFSIGLGT